MKAVALVLTAAFTGIASAQPTQTIRGKVSDADTRITLPGAMIRVMQADSVITGGVTDGDGLFRIEHVPVGRYTIDVSYTGYKPSSIADVIVTSAKEIVLEIELAEAPQAIGEVVITSTPKGEARNEMGLVSGRSFTIDETNRYAGGVGDPARMASNFAGVQGNDDSNNGIIVRGNSPYFLAWRLENIYIPNPNHLSTTGRTSGVVSMLNNKYLGNSDFFTGAFPASYGNSIGSVFDLRMRSGNNEQHEFTGQIGMMGIEAFGEGPIGPHPNPLPRRQAGSPKERGNLTARAPSYIINYRYATVAVLQKMGLDIGTIAVPQYHDLAFKLNFPAPKSNFSVFGLAGYSSSITIQSTITDTAVKDLYSDFPTDDIFRTGRATLGANWGKSVSSKTYLNIHAAGIIDASSSHVDVVHCHIENGQYVVDSITFRREFLDQLHRIEAGGYISTKPKPGRVLKAGVDCSTMLFDFFEHTNATGTPAFDRFDYHGWSVLVQPFVEYKTHAGEKIEIVSGLHGAYLTLNGSKSIEPRFGLRWSVSKRQNVSLGAGLHSQMQLPYYYLPRVMLSNGDFYLSNINLDFFRSAHLVAGYQRIFGKSVRVKTEVYFQYLYKIPVQSYPSSFSQLNEGEDYSDYIPDSLVSEGIGRNMGVELTIERFFSKGYFFLLTGSLFDAIYKGSDSIWRSTAFNGRYAANAVAGKEFTWGKQTKSTLGISAKVVTTGGRRATPIDTAASVAAGRAIYIDSLRNSFQLRPYFRTDLRISYRLSARKVTHEIGLDLINLFDTRNILRRTYLDGQILEVTQLGFLPVMYYRIDL